MRTLSSPVHLAILLPLAITGCSGIGGVKSDFSPNIRTITSIGDQPLPVVEGAPGSRVAADRDPPARRPDPQGRISGRVLDVRGQPVTNARVRIATSGAERGQVVRTTTDGSGAFTLQGLRPGGEYTVLAEADDAGGIITGRMRVRAPATQVRIRLRDLEDAPAPGRQRVSPVSNRDDFPEPDGEPRQAPQLNSEDLPPATEAEALAAPARARVKRPVLQLDAPVQGTGWQRGGAVDETDRQASREPAGAGEREESAPAARQRTAAQPGPADDDDEGPNPLPPALERDQVHPAPVPSPVAAPAAAGQEAAPAPAAVEPAPAARQESVPAPAAEPAPSSAEPAPGGTAESPAPALAPAASTPVPQSTASQPAAAPEPAPSTDPGGAAGSSSPAAESAPADGAPQASASTRAPGAIVAAAGAPPASNDPLDPSSLWPVDDGAKAAGPDSTGTAKRPTWAELTAQYPALAVAATDSKPVVAPPSAARSQASGNWAQRSTPVSRVAARATDTGKATCRYDSRRRRLLEFRLPDLQGQPVRLQDLNADYVLLDFWGTWCGPCRKAIPHLIELQNQLGPERLRVVGIAYEEGTPAERAAAVSETAQRLGINYTLLLGGLDGPCPLQTALKVQAYPTLILLDRTGRVLWRDTGASSDTLSRLDRVLASATRVDTVRR